MSGNYYLIGELSDKFDNNLPSKKQVLSKLLYRHVINGISVKDCLKEIACELEQVWEAANIPTQNHYRIQGKVKSLHLKWNKIKINKKRNTRTQKQNERDLLLYELFDITYNNGLDKMDIKDKELLELVEPISIASKSDERKEYWKKFKEIGENNDDDEKINELSGKSIEESDSPNTPSASHNSINELPSQEPHILKGNDTLSLLESDSSDVNNNTSDDSYVPPKNFNENAQGKKKQNIMTPELSSALDRGRISNSTAVFVLAAAAVSMNVDPENLVLNRESFRQKRCSIREKRAKEICEAFNPQIPLTVHWDGKMMRNSTKLDKVDRIVVAVTGAETTKILAEPFLTGASSGENIAQLVYDTLLAWNLLDRIEFMCFDTTSSNTGVKNGACVLLEDKIDKHLLKLACRHHFLELVAGNAYRKALNDVSVSPGIVLFDRFSKSWKNIDKGNYESCLHDITIRRHILPIKDKVIKFVQEQLNKFHHRDDYKELLYLTLLFLGEKPVKYVFQTCGSVSRARWMSKLIYCLKIYLFRSQFDLSLEESNGIRYFNVFIVSIYIIYWYQAPCALRAASNDLQMLNDLVGFKIINEKISDAAIDKLGRHLWYLSTDVCGIAFFDESIENTEKIRMVKALSKKGTNRIVIDLEKVGNYKISDFISKKSLEIFKALKISEEFLKFDPKTWTEREDYVHGRNEVKKLNVVNDVAERGVALASYYNGFITKNEPQRQCLYQIVEENRQVFPTADKGVILKGLNRPSYI